MLEIKTAARETETRLVDGTPPSVDLMGLRVSSVPFETALDRVLLAPARGERIRVHFCALHTLVAAAKDDDLRESLNEADIAAPDGAPLLWMGRAKGQRLERVCGPDMMLEVMERTSQTGARHFLYGSTPDVLSSLVETLRRRCPGVCIAGSLSPPFRPLSDEEVQSVAQTINDARPDYVWVGLGSPKQDRWLAQFRPLLDAPVLLAVGAAFDFHSGRVRRAPRWAQRAGVEWAFRIVAEPRRLAGRYAFAAAELVLLLAAQRWHRWRSRL